MTVRNNLTSTLRRLWRTDAPLTATGVLMLAALAGLIVAMTLDQRTITGAPVWLKPGKFAISIAIYCFTLAWIFTLLPGWPRMRRLVGWTAAIVFIVEVAIIAVQAGRGTTSHFNTATIFDGVLFSIMGVAIVTQTITSVAVAVALWRQPLSNRVLGRALRLGMIITIAGASIGGLMTRPTAQQMAAVRESGNMPIAGAHTVGAPDGGRGLPITGWSRDHGDIRVAHFFGLHALQVLVVCGLLIGRARRPESVRLGLVSVAAGGYVLLIVLLLWQALRSQAVLQPDTSTLVAAAVWFTLIAGAALFVARRGSPLDNTPNARA